MLTEICQKLGLQFPIFAFSHCRDVVVAVSKAGGIGVYGGALHSPEQVEIDLTWIERQLDGAPYGVDLLLAQKYVSIDDAGIAKQDISMRYRLLRPGADDAQFTRLARDYEWQGRTYPGDLTLFWADESASADATMGWGSIVTGDLDIVRIPVTHEAVLQEGSVKVVAEALAAAMAAAVSGRR